MDIYTKKTKKSKHFIVITQVLEAILVNDVHRLTHWKTTEFKKKISDTMLKQEKNKYLNRLSY